MTVFSPLKAFYGFLVAGENKAQTTVQKFSDPQFWGKGIVSETIRPFETGRVQFQGSWWPAMFEPGISEQAVILEAGHVVQVIGRQNITLIVQPIG
jgi:membrane protein implicated in regulation of membrane protease activity